MTQENNHITKSLHPQASLDPSPSHRGIENLIAL